jgi:putative oxidoreductase
MAVHGAQKLFGAFDGPGLDRAGGHFERLGLRPGKPMAALAGGSEFVGGVLTAAGLGGPVGPLAIAGAMTVAATTHLDKGPMGQKGGYELPMVDLAAVTALAATGPGGYSLDRLFRIRLPKGLIRLFFLGTAGLTGYCATAVLRTRKEQQQGAPPVAEPAQATPAAPPTGAAAAPTGATGPAPRSPASSNGEVITDAEGANI